jgi:succinate dehydrogenase/fumarate reductase cytochrome b subunit
LAYGDANSSMDQSYDELTLADLMSDLMTLAIMDADGIEASDLNAKLNQIAARFTRAAGSVDHRNPPLGSAVDHTIPANQDPGVSGELTEGMTTRWRLRIKRNSLRLVSGLVLLAFVLCHLTAHSFLLISFEHAEAALDVLMYPWRTAIGTAILLAAVLTHYLNALWSIYVRRYLRLLHWEWWQLGLGLCIPPLLMLHVTSTRIAESLLAVKSHYSSVLIVQWQLSPWLGALQVMAVLAVWIHACIGVHFWLRTKAWYASRSNLFIGLGLLLPTLALAGYVSG